jgi:GNAT superfamily N-acetyltransferase
MSAKYRKLLDISTSMRIVSLSPVHEKQYFCCLEEYSQEVAEAGDHKACWYAKMKDHGLRVKIAENDEGKACGMIQYVPTEMSTVEGPGLYLVLCVWVHGHRKEGVGNMQKRGLGKALLAAAEDDVRSLGGKGIAVWGIILPFFMRASWYRKQGYKVVDKHGMMRLLWKPFTDDAVKPHFLKERELPALNPAKVNVSVFINGWCPVQNLVYERAKKAVIEFQNKIEFEVYHTNDSQIMKYWGISDALFINGKKVWTGPPPSFKKIHRLIEKQVKKLREPVLR